MTWLTIDKISILLIEPSTAQSMVIEQAIRECGVEQIERVDSGSAGLDIIKQYPPDLIVSSLYLPDMRGSELLEALRRDPSTAAIPFVLISSETRFDALDPVRQAGAVAILPKPFTQEQLNHALYATLHLLEPEALDDGHIDLHSLRVLLVDDSQLAREHMQRLLESLGITAITLAQDGREAIKIMASETFDLVMSDYHMPHVDGKALTVHIRNHSQHKDIPILMVTSDDNRSRLAALHACGVSAVCNKPFDLKNIRYLIEQAVG